MVILHQPLVSNAGQGSHTTASTPKRPIVPVQCTSHLLSSCVTTRAALKFALAVNEMRLMISHRRLAGGRWVW